jgi:hypothetical protein
MTAKLTTKDQGSLTTSLVKQLLEDRAAALKAGQATAAVQASRAIASLLGLQVDADEQAQPTINVTIDRDLARVVENTPARPAHEPSPEDRELAQKLLKLLEKQ